MNILLLHNSYSRRGGEDVVVEAEARLLRDAGHDVRVEIVSNLSIEGASAKVGTFLRAPYDRSRKTWISKLLKDTGASLVHVHNFFPLLSPAVHEASAELGLAVVQTLHNFRLVCAGALLLRNGRECEKCISGSNLWGVVHRCYRDSMLGSLAVVRMQARAQRHGTWQKHVHRFIAPSEFVRRKFIEGGLPANRIMVKPNFVARLSVPSSQEPRRGALFVGRLSQEKGVGVLVDAWRLIDRTPLVVVGDGPLRAQLETAAPPNVRFLGELAPTLVAEEMRKAQLLIVPSICYESFPMVIAEAFSMEPTGARFAYW